MTEMGQHRTILLFTSFPVSTETFLQREVSQLLNAGDTIELVSLWGGEKSFQGVPIYRVNRGNIIGILFRLFFWMIRKPTVFFNWSTALTKASPRNIINTAENLWALCAAAALLPHIKKTRPNHLHAVWASMPATAAWLLADTFGISWSMGAHAYDIFEDGGDWLLYDKIQRARFIRTSTNAAADRLRRCGAAPSSVQVVRRGLARFPDIIEPRSLHAPIRLLSVGRLVAKKGYFDQLRIYAAAHRVGIAFEVWIIGDGPLALPLRREADRLGLARIVQFKGFQPYAAVTAAYGWADLFVFTGRIAPNGDRDGLPNVIAEAMAHGVPVLTAPGSGVSEAVTHGVTGFMIPINNIAGWVQCLKDLRDDPHRCQSIRRNARQWVENAFDLKNNMAALTQLFSQAASTPTHDTTKIRS